MQVEVYNDTVRQDSSILDGESLMIPLEEKSWEYIRKYSSNVELALTNKCNMFCNVCYNRNSNGKFYFDEMKIETIKKILKNIGKYKKVLLFGGEPTLRKDLFEIIKLVKLSGNIPILYTNGIKLADKHYVDKLVQAGIKKIYFSIDGLNVNSTTSLRGDSTYHYLKLKAIDNLRKSAKIKVWLSSTIARGINENEVGNLLDFAIRNNHFIKGIIFIPFNPIGWCQIPVSAKFYSSDIINILKETTNGSLCREYFNEFNRLRCNLNKFLDRFRRTFPLYKNSVYTEIVNGNVEQFIPLRDLLKINSYLEKGKYFKLVKFVFQKGTWQFVLKALLRPSFIEFVSYKRKGLHIMVDNINFPTHDFSRLPMITIGLSEWKSKIFSSIII